MATWTKVDLANNTLEWMGVKAAGQSVSGEHSVFVQKIIDSIYDQFLDMGLAPYYTSAIPEWAQMPFMKYLAVEIGPRFGKPYPEELKSIATGEMARTVHGGPRGKMPTRSKDF